MPAVPSAAERIITIPNCEKGLGAVIRQPDDASLISGVELRPYPIHPDDRGYFLEIARLCEGMVEQFPPATTQVSAALSYPGTIKAFHFHKHQTDFWVPVMGMFQVALVDLRAESPTFGQRNTIYAGALRPLQMLIPPGVGHGYKVLGTEAAVLVYVTNRKYDPSDEGRIRYNDEKIQYDWEIQHK